MKPVPSSRGDQLSLPRSNHGMLLPFLPVDLDLYRPLVERILKHLSTRTDHIEFATRHNPSSFYLKTLKLPDAERQEGPDMLRAFLDTNGHLRWRVGP